MIERQRVTANIFSDLGSTPRQEASAPSPAPRLQLDAGAYSLPTKDSRTPIKSRADLGVMDVYLGSSSTPQARNRSQQVVRDESDVVTPIAVRTVRLLNRTEELGSSPPRFKTDTISNVGHSTNIVSFDDETTIDEDVLLDPGLGNQHSHDDFEDEFPTDIDTTDLPSSTIELQLTAQFHAELNTQLDIATNERTKEPHQEFNNVYVDAPSQQLLQDTLGALGENDTNVKKETRLEVSIATANVTKPGSSSISRVGDSFSSQVSTEDHESPIRSVRRSSRITSSSPVGRYSANKREHNHMEVARKAKMSKKDVQDQPSLPDPMENEQDENPIVVISPPVQESPRVTRSSKRKSTGLPQSPADSSFIVPGTTHKPSMLRSTSLLSQVETLSEDVPVEDTPAAKRARRGAIKDVSEARTPPQGSHVKRLSHVRVTPKSSSSLSSLPSSATISKTPAVEDGAEIVNVNEIPTQQGERMHDENVDVEIAQQLQLDAATSFEHDRSQQQELVVAESTPRRPIAERSILTPRSIMDKLKGVRDLLRSYKDMVLGKPEERELDDILFDIRVLGHAASARGT